MERRTVLTMTRTPLSDVSRVPTGDHPDPPAAPGGA
jgi:hypothetical protein